MFVCTALFFHVCELGVVGEPYEFYGSDGTVSLFCDDDFGNVFLVGVFVVVVVTVKEHNYVGILLDRSGFSEVGKHGTVIRTLFHSPGELRKGYNRNVQFSGYRF